MADILNLFYSWQAVLVTVACVGVTQLVKTIIDVARAKRREIDRKSASDLRHSSLVLNRIVMPLMPIAVGFVVGALVPFRPDILTDYVEAKVANPWMALGSYGFWGAACGQFSGFIYDKVRELISTHRMNNNDQGDV